MRIKLVNPEITPEQRARNIVSSLCVMPNLVCEVDDERVVAELVRLLKGEYRLSNAAKVDFFRETAKGEVAYSLDEMEIAMKREMNVFPSNI